jgi:uncharacterized protein YndB with AHSA1/START domain
VSIDDDYQATVEIAAPPEAVFDALTTLDGLAGWWTEATGDARAGGEVRFHFTDRIPAVMRVEDAAPERVRWTCLGYTILPDWGGTTITFALSPRPGAGTTLAFRHRGLTPRLECYDGCKNGWDFFLPSLRAYAETGQGTPWQSPPDRERRAVRA